VNDDHGVAVRSAALDVLLKVSREGAYSQLALHHAIEKSGFHSQDTALLTQMVYGTIQWRLTLDYHLKPFLKKGARTKPWVKELLRLSVYQLAFLDKIPHHAVVNVAVEIAKKRGGQRVSGFVNGVLRAYIRTGGPDVQTIQDAWERKEILHSHPRWLLKRWTSQYGEEATVAICKANHTPPDVTIRVNRLKWDRKACLSTLREAHFDVKEGNLSPDAIVLKKGKIIDHPIYKEGKVTIQDESSMLVARALDAKPGQRVLDACSGPGGKTTHIAELMDDTGEILALDIYEHKIGLVRSQAARLGLSSIKTMVADARRTGEIFPKESFDRILIDAPCSGFGVIRRKPEIKYEKTAEDVASISRLQREILDANAPLLKKSGVLVYSTCTIDKEENVFAVQDFLKTHPDFTIDTSLVERLPEVVREKSLWFADGMCQILPQHFGTDGFFIAAFLKR